jgi:aspartyl-tRNA(Asn)/glutamyl-tRNA(Gln) amidotransferase subunit B
MRSKEEAHDYRYFPDPDLLPLTFDQAWVDELARDLPELPDEKRARFIRAGLSAYDASVLVAEKEATDYFEAMVTAGAEPKAAANWLSNEYFGRLNKAGLSIAEGPISPERASLTASMVRSGVISSKLAKDLTDIMWQDPRDPRVIVEERGLKQVTDEGAIEAAVAAVMTANPDKCEEVKAKPKAAAWFVGQVMKATGGKANPQTVNAILRRRLGLPEEG